MHQTLRSVAFYDGGHALVTEDVTADPARVMGDVREAVFRFEARLTGLRVGYVVSRLEGVVVYRRDALAPEGRWAFSARPSSSSSAP